MNQKSCCSRVLAEFYNTEGGHLSFSKYSFNMGVFHLWRAPLQNDIREDRNVKSWIFREDELVISFWVLTLTDVQL